MVLNHSIILCTAKVPVPMSSVYTNLYFYMKSRESRVPISKRIRLEGILNVETPTRIGEPA